MERLKFCIFQGPSASLPNYDGQSTKVCVMRQEKTCLKRSQLIYRQTGLQLTTEFRQTVIVHLSQRWTIEPTNNQPATVATKCAVQITAGEVIFGNWSKKRVAEALIGKCT